VTLPEAPRRRLQVYETAAVTVTFDPNRCIHSGVCLRTLPTVFDVGRRRWVRPELADAGEVIAAVRKCPSGALQFREPGAPGVADEPVGH
jgi:uncharacterized Fe-S cluster protein YjdI